MSAGKFSRLSWPLLFLGVALGTGCSQISNFLGADGEYLLNTYDALVTPGQEVQLLARLESNTLLRELDNRTIRFLKNDKLFKTATTDDEGFALATFSPPSAGDYIFTIEVDPAGLQHRPPEPMELLIACRTADSPIIVVDLDNTLSRSGSWSFFSRDPQPMPNSVEVMRRLAEDYTVTYLTYRLEQLGRKSKVWLQKHGYPRGPLLMSRKREFFKGSGRYKTEELQTLKGKFTNIQIGIGDKTSDAQAYHDNGMEAFLILHIDEPDDPEDYLELAKELDQLPQQVQAVRDWAQIEAAIYDGKSFPRSAAQEELRRQAEDLKKQRKPFRLF